MKDNFKILEKPEAFTFDELFFIKEAVSSILGQEKQLNEKLFQMENSLKNNESSMAVFFMPENTFNIFSAFQGDNSICEIALSDVERLADCISNLKNSSEKMKDHISKKINVLLDYLKAGNKVKPVPIQASNFTVI